MACPHSIRYPRLPMTPRAVVALRADAEEGAAAALAAVEAEMYMSREVGEVLAAAVVE